MKRILVPIDFSDVTPRVVGVAQQFAKALDSEIHLIHVRELSAVAVPGALGYGLVGMPELAPMSGMPVPVGAGDGEAPGRPAQDSLGAVDV